jgi:hypothetical protein
MQVCAVMLAYPERENSSSYVCTNRRDFPFRVSQHQRTDLNGTTKMQPVRGWLWVWWMSSYSNIKYNVDRSLLNLIATDCSAVFEEETNLTLYTNKILQLFAVDYNGPGSSLLQRPSSIIILMFTFAVTSCARDLVKPLGNKNWNMGLKIFSIINIYYYDTLNFVL